jgi:hypothetical protein
MQHGVCRSTYVEPVHSPIISINQRDELSTNPVWRKLSTSYASTHAQVPHSTDEAMDNFPRPSVTSNRLIAQVVARRVRVADESLHSWVLREPVECAEK